jgi:hypothetical protein
VLISAADGVAVEASAVTIDEFSDADAVDLPPAASALSAPITVWLGLTRRLPMRTLEQYTGDVTVDSAGQGVLATVAKAGRRGEAAVSPADPKIVFRARMIDTLDEIEAAPIPQGTGQLASMLKDAQVPVSELGELLDVNNAAVLALCRGQRVLDAEQAARLAPRLGRKPRRAVGGQPGPAGAAGRVDVAAGAAAKGRRAREEEARGRGHCVLARHLLDIRAGSPNGRRSRRRFGVGRARSAVLRDGAR